jgi:hypothetical protein
MSELLERIKEWAGGGDGEARMRMALIAALAILIVGCLIGSIAMLFGGGAGGPVREAPEVVHFWCQEQQREVTVPYADVKADENAWGEAGNDVEAMKYLNPATGRRTLVPMSKCPSCGRFYVDEKLKRLTPPTAPVPVGSPVCPHCGVNAVEFRQKQLQQD